MTDKDQVMLEKIYRELQDVKNRLNHFFLEELNLKETAIELKLSESTLYKLDPLKLPFFKRGKFRIYRKVDILEYKKILEEE